MKNRNQLMRQDRESGKTYEEIAQKYGISKQRVKQIMSRFDKEEYLQRVYPDLVNLPPILRQRLIKNNLTLRKAKQMPLHELEKLSGIGPSYALQIKASMLGK